MYLIAFSPAMRRRLAVGFVLVTVIGVARLTLWAADAVLPVTGGPRPIRQVPTEEGWVALTFNVRDGERTPREVLAILERYDAVATFFVAAPWLSRHTEWAEAALAAGNQIASLGYNQASLTGRPAPVVKEEIERAARAIGSVTGAEPRLYRPPNGEYDATLLSAANEIGHGVVLWRTDSYDWLLPGPDSIIRSTLERTRPGDILLLHAGAGARQTPVALPALILGLRDAGFKFGTLNALLGLEGEGSEPSPVPEGAPLRR